MGRKWHCHVRGHLLGITADMSDIGVTAAGQLDVEVDGKEPVIFPF